MSRLKKIALVAAFVIGTLIIPYVFLVLFVDAINHFNVYVIVTAIIVFSIWGYIIVSIHSMSKELKEAVEAMRMQNAAIAYKLTEDVYKPEKKESKSKKKGNKIQDIVTEEQEDTSSVNLNPQEPLVPTKNKSKTKNEINDNYDDFK